LSSAHPIPARNPAQSGSGRGSARDQALDVAKGFGIVLVVVGHCLDGLVAGNYFPQGVLWPALAIYAIYLFHMPLFFVVSGFLASGKHRPAGTVIAKILPTIAWPYVLWSAVQNVSMVYLSRYTTSKLTFAPLLRIGWIPIVPYWFLYALFFCHVLYLTVRRRKPWVQLSVATVLFVVPLLFESLILKLTLGVVFQVTRGFLFFVMGVAAAGMIKELGRWAAVVATLLYAALAVAYYQAQLTGPLAPMLMVPVSIAGIVMTLGWSRSLADARGSVAERVTAVVAFFGRYSMSIYVMHIFFTAGVRIALRRYAVHPTMAITVTEIVAATVVGTLAPLGINWVLSKVHVDKWLGLQRMETA
jgi:fucose 4-O-acetylase-like acetyltransferase